MRLKRYKDFITEKIIHQEMPLPNDVIEIAKTYYNYGYELYVVGGAVRDFLQGKSPHDYDLTTNALPKESKRILKGFNVSDEQGSKFGVLRVYTKDEPLGYEIAAFRRDISHGRDTKGDDDKVEIGKHITIADDCARRDLTINALFYDINKREIVDLVGGVEDIKNNIIRTVGNPEDRFNEDRLRILRALRACAVSHGKIDPVTSEAIKEDNRLKGMGPKHDVSQERIIEEMYKAHEKVKNYNDYLNLLTEYNMWGQIFPGSNINTDLVDSKDLVIIFANLFKNDDTNRLDYRMVQNYKIPGDIANKAVFLIKLLSFKSEDIYDTYKKKVQIDISDEEIKEWFRVNNTTDRELLKFTEYKPSISSKELIDQGFKGKSLGDEIKRLEIENYKLMQ